MRKFSIIVAVGAALLSACGGSSSSITGESGTGSTTGGGTSGTTTVSMGSGTGSTFEGGVLAISTKSLSAGGSSSLSVSLVDQTGALYTTATTITFSSPCQAQGLATITATGVTPAAASVTTSTGAAEATYVATGCSGSDVITATATTNSQNLSATGTVTVAAAAVGSISFISATPSNITLKGTGATTSTGTSTATSTVVFKVVDTSGGPSPNATVNFALSTSVGGITLAPTSATTDANGQVQTVVSGGTVATTVRVTATTTASGSTISTESSALTVSTGVPTSNNISLAVQCQNVESYGYDGVTVPVTVRMTDRFSNPVPDGTTANFQTTLGGIQATCQTGSTTSGSGACLVNWTSKTPYVINGNPTTTANNALSHGAPYHCDTAPAGSPAAQYCNGTTNGRSPIIATAIGEESFVDTNGSGVFNSSSDTVAFDPTDADNDFPGTTTPKAWFDTSEPFLNEWEIYDSYGTPTYELGEPFIDFNNNGKRDGPDNLFEGALCTGTYCNSASSTVAIFESNIVVESGSQANYTVVSPTSAPPYKVGSSLTLKMFIYDQNWQQMPNATTVGVTFSTNAGTLSSPAPQAWPCSTAAPVFNSDGSVASAGQLFTFVITPTTSPTAGSMFVTVTTPRGLVTTFGIPLTP